MYRLLIPALLLLTISACKKDKEIKEDSLPDFTFTNTLDKRANVFIYASKDDYDNAANAVTNFTVDANGEYKIPGSTFEKGKEYYTDWFTDDYKHSNWPHNSENTPGVSSIKRTIAPSVNGSYSILANIDYSHMRQAFIHGNESSSVWESINTTPEKTVRIVIKKNYSVEFTQNGQVTNSGLNLYHNAAATINSRRDAISFSYDWSFENYFQFRTADTAVYSYNADNGLLTERYIIVRKK